MRIASLLAAAIWLAAAAPTAEAQRLDGQWFKATATASGWAHDFADEDAEKAKFPKLTSYIQLFAVEGGVGEFFYDAVIWAQTGDDTWVPAAGGGIGMLDDEETAIGVAELTMLVPGTFGEGPSAQGFDVFFVGSSTIKVKNEELKSAKLKSTAAIAQGSLTGDDFFVGAAKVSLTRVPEEKLPFTPAVKADQAGAEPTLIVPAWAERAPAGMPVMPLPTAEKH